MAIAVIPLSKDTDQAQVLNLLDSYAASVKKCSNCKNLFDDVKHPKLTFETDTNVVVAKCKKCHSNDTTNSIDIKTIQDIGEVYVNDDDEDDDGETDSDSKLTKKIVLKASYVEYFKLIKRIVNFIVDWFRNDGGQDYHVLIDDIVKLVEEVLDDFVLYKSWAKKGSQDLNADMLDSLCKKIKSKAKNLDSFDSIVTKNDLVPIVIGKM
ncbi:unknown [Spodoptera litura nucleopolyhedrovirus]|uniref:Uncharacterized protein n=1 Tax=Spodoptera litura multicapsid nucleopolyhedrovirus TaxID=46242 RepID=Q91BF4_NPVST|nr:hypothetical protein [Spodoptera litura nucleopolyhedrovirus]WML75135.1 hypothetical protein KBIHDJOI_00092 [Spodoptera littoralis nucleopolyhedrovirus]AAL01753.1 unknown [Spodoptera litura nucleopolyhedrovirus]QHN73920.1 hypothetical protein [Spodoptera litura nucleopolyhedrovirus]UQV25605.1 hypothetical protein [Spodoptera litura nucleopolyhedrovirus]WOC30929.1 hypothetical protein GACBDANE_00064 [Spodoptera litura nucleopolyhedrovirus]